MFQRYISYSSLFLAITIVLCSCSHSKSAHTKRLPGLWQETPILIDGKNNDWTSPYPEYDTKAMVGYAVSNDKQNLYISVESGDPATQFKILRGGLTVWIDRTGKSEQTVAINYPIPPDNKGNEGQKQQNDNGQPRIQLDMTERVKRALPKADQYSLQGFKACNNQYSIDEKDTCGIQVSISMDENNELVWEAKVPFKTFYTKAEIDNRDRGRPLSICIETTGLNRPPGQANSNRGGGNGGGFRPGIGIGGGGMRFGGGMGSGMHGGGNRGGNTKPNPNEQLYKSTTTWKKFGIAFKNVTPPAPVQQQGN